MLVSWGFVSAIYDPKAASSERVANDAINVYAGLDKHPIYFWVGPNPHCVKVYREMHHVYRASTATPPLIESRGNKILRKNLTILTQG